MERHHAVADREAMHLIADGSNDAGHLVSEHTRRGVGAAVDLF